jgi:hypothetical protein
MVMADLEFANFINTTLLKQGAMIEASKHMNLPAIRRIIPCFSIIDPYVQAVVLQSVINLPSHEVDAIKTESSEMIGLASDSEDEWVRRKAAEFRNFPELIVDDAIAEFDFSGVFPDKPTGLLTFQRGSSAQRNRVHFTLAVSEMAPSNLLPPVTWPQLPLPQPSATEWPQPKPAMIQGSTVDMQKERGRESEKEREKEKERNKSSKGRFCRWRNCRRKRRRDIAPISTRDREAIESKRSNS